MNIEQGIINEEGGTIGRDACLWLLNYWMWSS